MRRLHRSHQIHQLLSAQESVTSHELMERLGISLATLKRDLTYMKNRLHASIIFDRKLNGYRYVGAKMLRAKPNPLPPVWYSAEEIRALLTMQHLLATHHPGGLLEPHIQPLLSRLRGLLGAADGSATEIQKRIHIEFASPCENHFDHFPIIGLALLRRKRLIVRYHARRTEDVIEHEVSPQRLVQHRGHWYLFAWSHLCHDLRAFSMEAIETAELLDTKTKDIDDLKLDRILQTGQGIFSGDNITWATLLFSPEQALRVASERWHPLQVGQIQENGSYLLRVPYTDDQELMMDIFKYGADCKALEPPALVDKVKKEIELMLHRIPKK